MVKYFSYPFATGGDVSPIPDVPPGDGSMSYQQGFTTNYELQLGVDPNALPIPRKQTNQLYNDITGAIQQLQQNGVPFFITSADNDGTAFPYAINSIVRYDPGTGPKIYKSLINGNTDVPPTNNWEDITSTGGPIGTIIDFAGTVLPADFMNCDGSAVSRTTYFELYNVLTFVQLGTINTTNTTVTGLTDTSIMYVGMPVEGNNIPAGTTIATIASGTTITLSNQPTLNASNVAMTFYPWGNGDGATTYNLPKLTRCTTIGSGSGSGMSPTVPHTQVGSGGGTETYTLDTNDIPAHTHDYSFQMYGGGANANEVASGNGVTTSGFTGTTSANTTTGNAVSLMQPCVIVMKAIKFI